MFRSICSKMQSGYSYLKRDAKKNKESYVSFGGLIGALSVASTLLMGLDYAGVDLYDVSTIANQSLANVAEWINSNLLELSLAIGIPTRVIAIVVPVGSAYLLYRAEKKKENPYQGDLSWVTQQQQPELKHTDQISERRWNFYNNVKGKLEGKLEGILEEFHMTHTDYAKLQKEQPELAELLVENPQAVRDLLDYLPKALFES